MRRKKVRMLVSRSYFGELHLGILLIFDSAMVSREERLRIWKIEKAKRLMKVKANAKPVFRVGTGSSFKNISVESVGNFMHIQHQYS